MKSTVTIFRKTGIVLLFSLFYSLFNFNYAQDVLTNVKVNTFTSGDQQNSGEKAIAIAGDSVYVVYQDNRVDEKPAIYFAKSINKGDSFLPEVNICPNHTDMFHIWPCICVDAVGTIYVTWTAVTLTQDSYNVWFARSVDGGVSFEEPKIITTSGAGIFPYVSIFEADVHVWVYILYADGTEYPLVNYSLARSTDGGETFDPAIQVNDDDAISEVNFEGLNALYVDNTGIVYATWVDGRRENSNGDIYFAKSTDLGLSFSTNIPVHSVSIEASDSVQFYPSVCASGDMVYVTWTDLRLGSNVADRRVYFAKSSDGGNSFDEETMISEDYYSHRPDICVSPNQTVFLAYEGMRTVGYSIWCIKSTNFGSSFSAPFQVCDEVYNDPADVSCVASADNNVYLAWNDFRFGDADVFFSRTLFDVGIAATDPYDKIRIYPNPATRNFNIYLGDNLENLQINIYDLCGKNHFSGNYHNINNLNIEPNLPIGIYLVYINDGKTQITKKLTIY